MQFTRLKNNTKTKKFTDSDRCYTVRWMRKIKRIMKNSLTAAMQVSKKND